MGYAVDVNFCAIMFVIGIVVFFIWILKRDTIAEAAQKAKLKEEQMRTAKQEAILELEMKKKKAYSKMLKLSKDKAQESAIQYILTCFEEKSCLKIIHIEPMLGYLEKRGVKGPDFRDLFLFLHKNLTQQKCCAEAEYLCIKTGL